MYLRHAPEPDYTKLSPQEMDWLRTYYRSHKDNVLGVGKLKFNLWIPDIMEDNNAGSDH
jgi:hypothetical protein